MRPKPECPKPNIFAPSPSPHSRFIYLEPGSIFSSRHVIRLGHLLGLPTCLHLLFIAEPPYCSPTCMNSAPHMSPPCIEPPIPLPSPCPSATAPKHTTHSRGEGGWSLKRRKRGDSWADKSFARLPLLQKKKHCLVLSFLPSNFKSAIRSPEANAVNILATFSKLATIKDIKIKSFEASKPKVCSTLLAPGNITNSGKIK